MEQIGTSFKGSTTYKQLMKSSNGPTDIIACVLKGGAAVSYPMGAAMVDDANNAGVKRRYVNGEADIAAEAVGTGDGSTVAFDLANSGVILGTLKANVNGVQALCELSKGTGTGGVDQAVFNAAPGDGLAVVANYSKVPAGACILTTEEATTATGPNITRDGLRDGSLDSAMVVDANGALADAPFRAALPRVGFD